MYHAVTFDTQTVRSNSFDFNGGLLKLLTQLRFEPTMVVVSEVVSSEILKHLSDHTQQVISSLDTAMKRAKDFGVGEFQMPADRSKALQISQDRYKKYLDDLGANTIPASDVEIKDVLKLYFQNLPPFSNKKKAEFPDAVALLSLEKWAQKNNYEVLAISGDSDWAAFGATSKRIDVVDDIAKALDILNGQATEIREIAGKALKIIAAKTDMTLYKAFTESLEDALKHEVVDSEADVGGDLHVVGSLAEISLRGFEFEDVDRFDLLAWDSATEIFVVAFEAELRIQASADFYFSVYDSTDEEYLTVGSSTKSVERNWSVQIYLAIVRADGVYEVGNAGVFRAPNVVHFGVVEPDHSNHHYEPPEDWTAAYPDSVAWQVPDGEANDELDENTPHDN